MTKKIPEIIDFNTSIGKRLMLIRMSSKLSQGDLGKKLGVKAQQIHKYETGENRLSAEAVQKCCEIFGVPVNYFYGNDAAFNVSDLDKTLMMVVSELTDLDPRVRADILKLVKTLKTII